MPDKIIAKGILIMVRSGLLATTFLKIIQRREYE